MTTMTVNGENYELDVDVARVLECGVYYGRRYDRSIHVRFLHLEREALIEPDDEVEFRYLEAEVPSDLTSDEDDIALDIVGRPRRGGRRVVNVNEQDIWTEDE